MAPTAHSLPQAFSAPNAGAGLRVCILRARWNAAIISALVQGCRAQLLQAGVDEKDITEETVPGSYELPFAAKAIITGSQTLGTSSLVSTATDLLTSASSVSLTSLASPTGAAASSSSAPSRPYDVVIAIGVLVKGSTMHFEYISDAVSHALVRVSLETNTPVVFGVLTCLTDEQALQRAGISTENPDKNHNHGDDWGLAAVELAYKMKQWKTGGVVGARARERRREVLWPSVSIEISPARRLSKVQGDMVYDPTKKTTGVWRRRESVQED